MDAECKSEVVDVEEGVKQFTLPLPLGIDHVHCYLLRASDGSWTLIDTGLGHLEAEEIWAPVLAALDAPIGRIVVTHAHPDHVGGAAAAAAFTGATVHQGRLDHARGREIWEAGGAAAVLDEFLQVHGAPEQGLGRRELTIRLPASPELLDEGDTFDGWQVLVLPGHADGHIALERDGVLVAGDTILGTITPHVGMYPAGLEDPLEEFVHSLERIAELRPRLTLPGHGPLLDDAAGRAREIVAHHAERLDATAAALGRERRTAWEVSASVFAHVPRSQQWFAMTETIAHLERLVRLGRARRFEGRPVRFGA